MGALFLPGRIAGKARFACNVASASSLLIPPFRLSLRTTAGANILRPLPSLVLALVSTRLFLLHYQFIITSSETAPAYHAIPPR